MEMARQDEERGGLSRALDDSALQYGSAVPVAFSLARTEVDPVKREAKISAAFELAERCTSEIRTVSYSLYPPLLDELGLNAAISIYLEDFIKRSEMKIEFEASDDLGRFSMAAERALFRVVR
jgi:signal transduction histidine kinase